MSFPRSRPTPPVVKPDTRPKRAVPLRKSNTNDVVKELKKMRAEMAKLQREQRVQESRDPNSPYLPDRPTFNPNRIKGTQREKAWKNILGQEEQIESMRAQRRQNLKKLDII